MYYIIADPPHSIFYSFQQGRTFSGLPTFTHSERVSPSLILISLPHLKIGYHSDQCNSLYGQSVWIIERNFRQCVVDDWMDE